MAVFSVEDCAASRAPGRMLRRLDKVMSAFVESKLGDHDLSYQQWIALRTVTEGIVGNPGQLARELGITTGAATRLIDVLETRGLLERDRGDADRRVVRLAVTPAGRDMVFALQPLVVNAWNEVVAEYSQQEAAEMVAVLVKLLAAAERVAGDLPPVEREA
ncbi:MarR family winged helix-turn-helix transcriptional regulator [Sphingomonas echinoides]|jgi:DNA-binding MarR family transcriptional regulator|uniref:MarR family transcriptional regulator n=3 Tax=Pseudomonadota TaxID=1224 RepID=A0ABU4PKG5_9SPHN|nr:MarR family transcriptional regulator [Sphingomonas echinoides]MDX5984332.1 MarR family transcriptional regulator [Sphingomonas echinoides]